MFVGTPCQVYGLKQYVGDCERLYMIDLLCLGVSSPLLFKKWLCLIEEIYKDKVTNVQFRNKRYGYSTPNVRVYFKKRNPIEQSYITRSHPNLYFKGYNLRPCCYECVFRELPRTSDFTIGDFSDVGEIKPNLDDDKGTTRLWAHTQKGKELLFEIEERANVNVVSENQRNVIDGSKKKIEMPLNREDFFKDVQVKDYYSFLLKWQPKTIKDDLIRIFRPLLRSIPGHTFIFKKIRILRNRKFQKNVDRLNNQ